MSISENDYQILIKLSEWGRLAVTDSDLDTYPDLSPFTPVFILYEFGHKEDFFVYEESVLELIRSVMYEF